MKLGETKIIIADDHLLFRDGLKTIIELSKIGHVIGDVSNGVELVDSIVKAKPDLAIVDIDMPVMNGIQATQEALKVYPDLNILVVTMFNDQKYYVDMINAGAKGFILKTSSKSELQEAITTVAKGGSYFSKDLLEDIMKNINTFSKPKSNEHTSIFSKSDIEILNLMLKGLSAKEISGRLNLTSKTVTNYKSLMLEKTGCNNSISLIVHALKTGAIHL